MRRPALLLAAAALAGCGASEKKEAAAPIAPAAVVEKPKQDEAAEIQVEGTLGTLDQEAVERPLAAHVRDVNACYQGGVEKLWYLGGKLEVKVRVRPDGGVKEVSTVSPLGNWAVERCIVELVRTLAFAKPKGNAEAEFNYSWDFRAKAALKEWGNDDVEGPFTKRRAELAACEKRGPVPPGLRVTFFVTPGGKVTSVGLGADTPVDESYARCVADRVLVWKFNDPLGQIARATYQFQ